MINLFCGTLFSAAAVIESLFLGKCTKRLRTNSSAVYLSIMSGAAMLWSVCCALFFFMPTDTLALIVNEIRFMFIMATGFSIYAFIFHTLKKRNPPKKYFIFTIAMLALQLLMISTNHIHQLMRRDLDVVYIGGLRNYAYAPGPWFYLHNIISYTGPVLAAWLIVRRFWEISPAYRKPLLYMLFGLAMVLSATLLGTFGLVPWSVDPAPVMIIPILFMFYSALFRSRSFDMLYASRNFIFENAKNYIMVIGIDGKIADYNKNVATLAKRLGIHPVYGRQADEIIEAWKNASNGRFFEMDNTIFTITENGVDRHYRISRAEIIDEWDRKIGASVELDNITPIMSMVHSLQDMAYFDHLTKLPNRRFVERKLEELDCAANYPLCIVVGDVNGLKTINDRHGHLRGDMLLEQFVAILKNNVPEHATLARVGGDEFLCIIPSTDDSEAKTILSRLDEQCKKHGVNEFDGASIALGYTLKTNTGQEICKLIEEADRNMYENKWNRRRR